MGVTWTVHFIWKWCVMLVRILVQLRNFHRRHFTTSSSQTSAWGNASQVRCGSTPSRRSHTYRRGWCTAVSNSEWTGTLAHCVNFSHLPKGSFTAVALLAAVYLRVIADRVSRDRWRESLGFRREAQRLGLWVFVMGMSFPLMLLSLVIDRGTWWCGLLLETLVNQFVLTLAIALNTLSYRVKHS